MKFKKVVNLVLFTLILGLGVASCSDDDNGTPSNNSQVVGTWKFNKLLAGVETVDSLLTDSVTNYIDTMRVAKERTYLFKPDGTYENNPGEKGSVVIKGKYEVSGNKIILDNKTDTITMYTFASDTLKMTESVKAKAAVDLKISIDSIMKADKVEVFYRISK